MNEHEAIRKEIIALTRKYYKARFSNTSINKEYIPYSGRVFDNREIEKLVDSSLDFWLTAGKNAEEFEKKYANKMDQKYCLLVNSGSSANLIALSSLTSPKLGIRRLVKGDEVISVAAGFPTTIAPIVQNGLVPVFLDVKLGTYNIDVSQLESALTDKTKAIFIAHTLGNPFDVEKVMDFANKNNLWVIEDCCDAVGATVNGKKVGTFGHIATVSFYPAHHMTMGEGGAVLTNISKLFVIARSFRDWGRDCYCEPGKDNTCGRRFSGQHGTLPYGYDHKYVYSHLGYNMKITDMQAAIGLAQLDKLEGFIEDRRRNFATLHEYFKGYSHYFILPEVLENHEPSWFGFPLTIKKSSGFDRISLVGFLEKNLIGTRLLFAGNMTKQPAFEGVHYKKVGNLENTDFVMKNTFMIGVYPGIGKNEIDRIKLTFDRFFETLNY